MNPERLLLDRRLSGVYGHAAESIYAAGTQPMKIAAADRDLLESVARGDWDRPTGAVRARSRYVRCADATLHKDRRIIDPCDLRYSWRRSR